MCAQCVESNGVGQLLVLVFSSQKLPGHRLEVALDVLLEARRLGGACLGLLELREGGPGPPASAPKRPNRAYPFSLATFGGPDELPLINVES